LDSLRPTVAGGRGPGAPERRRVASPQRCPYHARALDPVAAGAPA